MTLQEKAASLSREELAELLVSQQQKIDALTQKLDWLNQQMFGTRSERRVLPAVDSRQGTLGEQLTQVAVSEPAPARDTVRSYSRRKQNSAPSEDEPQPRFDGTLPVEVIHVPNPDIADLPPDAYTIVGEKETLRLAQKPISYVLIKYVRPVAKIKKDAAFSCPPAPASVLERCMADVSLLVGLLIDKFMYFLPLYRQHQRMLASGIRIDRSVLTRWVQQTILLLEPIYEAQMQSVLSSTHLAMDETPIKAGRSKRAPPKRGKMKTGFFWPIYGDQDEIVFPFTKSRAHAHVQDLLGAFTGTLLTDGFEAYSKYAERTEGLVHACCWSHARRYFVRAEQIEPALAQKALEQIGELYQHEEAIRSQGLEREALLEYRALHCKPVVDAFFSWLEEVSHEKLLLPTSPFTKALSYALERQSELCVFLEDPDVAVDTNHLEREIRPIALGRKNWLFAWTEVGAKHVGIIQSLIATCKLQGVDPYTYLVDVLQRIETHPAREVHLLTPRLWKDHFADQVMRSDIDPR